jgi:hypothetical protein
MYRTMQTKLEVGVGGGESERKVKNTMGTSAPSINATGTIERVSVSLI